MTEILMFGGTSAATLLSYYGVQHMAPGALGGYAPIVAGIAVGVVFGILAAVL